jgi:hypothetical protein
LLLGPAHVTNLLQKKAANVGELHAMHVLVWLGVHGGGLNKLQEHANNNKRPKYRSPDEHQSI